jgi:putative hydrolase of the HAD superfamily
MIQGLVFDINGTVSDIYTNEYHDEVYRVLGNFLEYQGITLDPKKIQKLFFEISSKQRKNSGEEFPEFDAPGVFAEIMEKHATGYTQSLPPEKLKILPGILAEIFRAASRFKLCLYPGVMDILPGLKKKYRLAALSDGQRLWAIPELNLVRLADFFDPVIISSDLGYRKPDKRMFGVILDKMQLGPREIFFIGNDMYHDILGASQMGIKTIFFKSNQGAQRYSGANPDYIIYNFSELPEAIRFLENNN